MRPITTAILALLLAGLATFYYVYDVRQAPEREKAATEKDRVFKGLEAKDVEEVTLKKADSTIQLRKTGDGWSLTAPVQARAETRAVEDLLSTVTTTRNERELEANPAKLADYGLAPPAAEITFKAKGQDHGLRLGGKNPTNIWVYAQLAGQPAVFLAPDSLLQAAQKPLFDFRDKTVLAFEAKDVSGLEVRPAAGPPLSAKKDGDAWQITQPLATPADREQVNGLLEKLKGAKIKEFVAEAAPPSGDPYGLAKPLVVTLWVGEEKARAARAVRLGKAVPEKKAVHAQREGEAAVFLIDEELVKAVPTTVASLRDKTVVAFDRTKLERVDVRSAAGPVSLALQNGAWRITAPAALKADEGAVSNLLGRVRDLKAKEFVADQADRLAVYGLDQPPVQVSLWEKDAKEPRTLLVAPAKGKDGSAYATVVAGAEGAARRSGPVVLVDAKALGELAQAAPQLRDRSLFESFDARDVTRVTIQQGGVTLVAERKAEDDWRLTGPKSGKAKGPRIEDLLWAMRGLRWRELVAEQGWDAGKYGLEPPAASVILTGKDGRTLAQLALGRQEGPDRFARIPGQPALYAIDPKVLGDLPAKPEDLLL
jgi:hypothetical protein